MSIILGNSHHLFSVVIFHFQLWKSAQKKNSLIIGEEHGEAHWGWSWLERWMAARPWETAYLDDEEQHRDGSYSEVEIENQVTLPHDWKTFPESPKRDMSPYRNAERTMSPQVQNQSVLDSRIEFCATVAEAESLLQPAPTPSCLHKNQAVSSPITTPKRTYPVIKQNKTSPSRGNGTQVHALDITSETIISNKHVVVKGSPPEEPKVHNKHMFVKGSSPEELKVPKVHERATSKPGLNRQSFSGPLKSMFGHTFLLCQAIWQLRNQLRQRFVHKAIQKQGLMPLKRKQLLQH